MKLFVAIAMAAAAMASGCITGNIAKEIPQEEHFNHTLLFCSDGNCLEELLQLINSSGSAKCALYNADESVLHLLQQKNAEAVVDKSVETEAKAAKRNSPGLMHNKFCVFDKRIVWTGSYNPVKRSSHDDVLIINSTLLAASYLEEFEELKTNHSSSTTTAKILLNNTLIENYFCPEDNCIGKLKQTIAAANKSIYFATYSFTHPAIANELIIKSSSGIEVKGVIENSGKYSQLQTLQQNNVAAVKDQSSKLMHHKFWVIDNNAVITGSFNPTRNGNRRNDENILVIHDKKVTAEYAEYFYRLAERRKD